MYVVFGKKIVDSKEVKDIIEENTEFKVVKDMTKGTKREDMLAFNVSISVDVLNEEIEGSIDELDEDTLFEEYMALAEEIGYEVEEYLYDEAIMEFKAYKWDKSDNDIKGIIAIANEELGMRKLKDVMRRLETQVE